MDKERAKKLLQKICDTMNGEVSCCEYGEKYCNYDNCVVQKLAKVTDVEMKFENLFNEEIQNQRYNKEFGEDLY